MRDPNCNASLATKPKKLPLCTQLFQHLQNHTGVYSPAGQPFLVFHPSGTSDNAGAFLLPVNSSTFRQHWLNLQLQSGNPIPSATTLRDATRALESKVFANSVGIAPVPTHIRLAWDCFSEPPSIVLALDTLHARHITITQNHWTPASTPNGFVYHPVQQPLPDPVKADEPELILRKFQTLLRLDDPNFQTLQSWLLTALQPAKDPAFHDYPILNFTGPPDSGKTVAAKLTSPNSSTPPARRSIPSRPPSAGSTSSPPPTTSSPSTTPAASTPNTPADSNDSPPVSPPPIVTTKAC